MTTIAGPTEQTMRDKPLSEVEADLAEGIAETQNAGGGALFDGVHYEVEAAKVDGLRADGVKITFGGGVTLEADDELFADLTLGSSFQLLVSGYVVGKNGAYKEAEDGTPTVTAVAKLRVDSITVK